MNIGSFQTLGVIITSREEIFAEFNFERKICKFLREFSFAVEEYYTFFFVHKSNFSIVFSNLQSLRERKLNFAEFNFAVYTKKCEIKFCEIFFPLKLLPLDNLK